MNQHDHVLETETVHLQNKNLSSFQIQCYCWTQMFGTYRPVYCHNNSLRKHVDLHSKHDKSNFADFM
jgi:hypothetical protein